MKKQQSGFTLIELMIVVAIIGILAAIAIPSYMDYTKKAKTAELINAMAPAKLAVSEYRLSEGDWPASRSVAGFIDVTTNVISSIDLSTDGIIVATGQNDLTDLVISLEPTVSAGTVTWECKSSGDMARLAPATCRN
jgi:type IV pilus assembly protein PilA